jgi:ribosomal-protein-alanine N-acetyltransferase
MTAAGLQWQLRPVEAGDLDALVRLTGEPRVYRYLFDGQPPAEQALADWIAGSAESFRERGVGCWILFASGHPCSGLVSLWRRPADGEAELIYALHPDLWGQGLATRMAASVIRKGLASSVERIVAGADLPNEASLAVIRRLGMRFLRDFTYPLGAGIEYELGREDVHLLPEVEPIPFAGLD